MGLRIIIRRNRSRHGSEWSRRFVWIAFGLALFGCAYALLSASGVVQVYRNNNQLLRLRAEVLEAEQANRRLVQEIRALRQDPQAIERLAREELLMGRPGETIYVLPPANPAPEPALPREPRPALPERR